jgi:uncharacterized protein YchJ
MKRIIFVFLVFISFLTACAGVEPIKKSMSDDLGSTEKAALLRSRVSESWAAFVKEDYEKVYALYDPFYRAKTDKLMFFGQMGKVKYHNFEIKDIKVEGNIAEVKLKVVYAVPPMKIKLHEFSVPETTGEVEEKWLYVYDNWYKEYYLQSLEIGVADY